jgi:hypothetical protein
MAAITVKHATLKNTVKGLAGLKSQPMSDEKAGEFVAQVEAKMPDWILGQAKAFCKNWQFHSCPRSHLGTLTKFGRRLARRRTGTTDCARMVRG